MNEIQKTIPNPESLILSRSQVASIGLSVQPNLTPPDGFAAVVLYVPIELILNKDMFEIQDDLGIPWHVEGDEPIWLKDLPS